MNPSDRFLEPSNEVASSVLTPSDCVTPSDCGPPRIAPLGLPRNDWSWFSARLVRMTAQPLIARMLMPYVCW